MATVTAIIGLVSGIVGLLAWYLKRKGKKETPLLIMFIALCLVAMYGVSKARAEEPIVITNLLPTRQLLVGHKQYESIVWDVYPVIYRINNEPHVCDDPNDPRRQFQFDNAYVIPREPEARKICPNFDFVKRKCKRKK